jgi:predicted phage terminase large subunit-like protein
MPAPNRALPPVDDLEARIAELCEQKLSVFIRESWHTVDPVPYVHGRHVDVMSEYLEAHIAGEIPNLLINVPPGHQKSLSVSVFLHPWTWTTKPQHRFMTTAYRGDLALRDADRARVLLRSQWYQRRWGMRIGGLRNQAFAMRPGADQKTRYSNDRGGYRFSTSVAGIMGEGGDTVALDDPHNVEEAESDEVLAETVRKLKLALPTRVRSKTGGVIVMMQRLKEKDFAGHLLAERNNLTHLCLPARFEPDHPFICLPTRTKAGRLLPGDWRTKKGELLWPELFDEARIKSLEDAMGSYGAAGQLQQRPVPREGGMFKRPWFSIVDAAPAGARRCRGWDFAGTTVEENATAPYTAAVRISEKEGVFYVEHVLRERLSPAGVDAALKNTAEQDGYATHIDYPQDPGQAGKSQAKYFAKMLPGYIFSFSPESGSKETRAQPFAAQAEAGNVRLVRGAWNEAYLDEVCAFPNGEYKDQTDASARAFHNLVPTGKKAGVW